MIDIESRIKPRLAATGASIALLAKRAGCSKTVLSEAANGTVTLTRDVALRVDAALRQLEEWIASIAPIKPDLRDARLVEQWLDEFCAKRKLVKPPEPDPWGLLQELNTDDANAVAARYGWSRSELISRLSAARDRMHELTVAISAGNNGL